MPGRAAGRARRRHEPPAPGGSGVSTATQPPPPPLAGLTVLDCGNFLAGPIVSLHLSALGADVIKVEKPLGDDARTIGPFAADGSSSYHLSTNRGKRSIAVDTRTAGGRKVFRALSARADVLVENYRPGVMDRLGIGYESLAADNPRLIYAAVSGFGQGGEHSNRPAFDSLLQACGGLISVTGPAGPDASPVRVGVSIVDICSGLHALIGVLAALHQRTLTGIGQRVDTSMLATTANLMESPISRHSYCGDAHLPRAEGLAHPVVTPFDGYKTKDGLLYIATSNDARAHVALKALGLAALVDDPDYSTNTARMANRLELNRLIEAKLQAKTTAEWERELVPAGVPCSAINNVKELKARHPEVFVNVEHPTAGSALQAGAPFEFGGATVDYARPAPSLGEHTDCILAELGYGRAQIQELKDAGVVNSSSHCQYRVP
eukprot:SAG22_NODE_559_length_9115_cov_4.969720_3_plen_435_part_00